MINIKYHAINFLAVSFFSFSLALSANQVVRYAISPQKVNIVIKKPVRTETDKTGSSTDNRIILDSGFFKLAANEKTAAVTQELQQVSDLQLLGTITGPPSIARAIIKKKSDEKGEIFKLYSEVFGYKLVSVEEREVKLKSSSGISVLFLYPEDYKEPPPSIQNNPADGGSGSVSQTLSRAELLQNMQNNMDNLLKGIRAGPYRDETDKVVGFKLIRVSPENMLYKFGARSGDIMRRINGHPIESTSQLYQIWQQLPKESQIVLDMERDGKVITFSFNITD